MYYSSASRRNALIMIVLAILLVVGIIYAAESLSGGGPYVPKEFTTTRAEAAQTASQIVSQANASITNLNAISAAYNSGKYNTALDLAIQEADRNNNESSSSLALSSQLSTMANDLYQVRPESAEQIGVQAIGTELQIVSKLIDYTGLTSKLLQDLRTGYIIQGNGATSTAGINSSLNQVVSGLNGDAQSVNSLNQQYLNLMTQFDTLTK